MNFDEQFYRLIDLAFLEDVGDGDHSTIACIQTEVKGKAALLIKQDGILAGVEVAEKIFQYKDANCIFRKVKSDGEIIKKGEVAFEVEATVHSLLQCERLVLNCMQRMSGIATLTKQYCNQLIGTKTQLLDTRKTTPNFRLFEKEAVLIGGGTNHRFGLFDMIMLKDNHIDFCGSIEKAIEKVHDYILKNHLNLKIEIEARNLADVKKIIEIGKNKISRIMLDNFNPEQIVEALKLIGKDFETEASGGIILENIKSYAATGVNFISVGALIHQAKSLDMSLKATQ